MSNKIINAIQIYQFHRHQQQQQGMVVSVQTHPLAPQLPMQLPAIINGQSLARFDVLTRGARVVHPKCTFEINRKHAPCLATLAPSRIATGSVNHGSRLFDYCEYVFCSWNGRSDYETKPSAIMVHPLCLVLTGSVTWRHGACNWNVTVGWLEMIYISQR